MKTMQKICLRENYMNIEDRKSKRRMMEHIARIEGVESVAEDTKERIITVIGDTDSVSLYDVLKENGYDVLKENGFSGELLSVGPAKPEKFKAKKDEKVGSAKQEKFKAKKGEKVGSAKQEKFEAEKKVGSKRDTENRGSNHYLGVQRAEAVGGFGGMNRAIEDNEGSEKRIREAVAGFGDFTIIEVDIKKGMVTVVGKSVPVSVALKVREMGYRAKLLRLGPATEEEDTDEEHNDDLYPTYPDPIVNDDLYPTYPDSIVNENACTILNENACTIA